MKIVQFGYTFLPIHGGEEHWIDIFSKFLESESYETVFIQRGFKDEFPDGKSKKLSEKITVVPVGLFAPRTVNGPVIDRQPFYSFLGFWKLWKIVKHGDIIVVIYPQMFFPAVWLIKKLKKNKVITVSVGITWDSPHHTFKEKLLYSMVKFFEKIALKGSDKIVAIDNKYVSEAKKFDRKSLNKVKVIYNFVQTDFYVPKKKGKQKIILCPRNLRYARGVDLAITGMKIVNASYKDAKLIILGDGPIKNELEMLIKKLNVNAEIRPAVGKKELRDYYRKASIVVVPSRYSEGSSFAGVEAMSCGTPLVVTNIGGLPDIVKNGYNGFMVNPDGREVGQVMLKILKDKKLASRMGRNGRKMALEKFSYKRFCQEWKKVLNEVTA